MPLNTKRQSDNYTYGGFLFIGLLLSLLFMIFLALVIYYKQITEGYSDRYNFEVMQKVGLDRNEISAIVGKKPATVGTLLARGRNLLKEMMIGGFDEDE